jgi:ADP-heptose:LPS heptosyltransferase
VSPVPGEPARHASLVFAAPAQELCGGPPAEPTALCPRPQDEAEALPLLGRLPERFLALHPGSGSPRKNWPAQRFAALAERLAAGCPFLVVEGPADERAAAPLRRPPAVIARGLSLRGLGALLSRAGLFVGNDSGVAHLAAAFGAPTLALFGPTSAAVWAPLGPRVRVLEAPGGALTALEVTAVAAAAGDALKSFGPPPLP